MSEPKNDAAPGAVLSTAGLGVTEDDLDNLRHMLGARRDQEKRSHGYRNHFAAASEQVPDMDRLVAAGLAEKGSTRGALTYYFATRAGCAAIGLTAAATKRAMEP